MPHRGNKINKKIVGEGFPLPQRLIRNDGIGTMVCCPIGANDVYRWHNNVCRWHNDVAQWANENNNE